MFARPQIYATPEGLEALRKIAARAQKSLPGFGLLEEELQRLTLVHSRDEPSHVRLGSRVVYKDLRTKRRRQVRVVDPADAGADAEENCVSILSPIGAALMGLTPGAIFRWQEPAGLLRAVKVISVENDA